MCTWPVGYDIPTEYQNQGSLSAITNYVLSGTNNTDDPKITELGKVVLAKLFHATLPNFG
jgi:hypothetical protein